MAKTIAICNQKGGVTKTTTTLNLGIGLVREGKKVLLIDGDPQNDLTSALGWNADALDQSLGRLMYLVTQDYKPIVKDAKTIKGPSKINASGDYDYITDEQYIEGDHKDGTVNGIDILGYGGNLFATLQNPTTTQEEEITIEWELEE